MNKDGKFICQYKMDEIFYKTYLLIKKHWKDLIKISLISVPGVIPFTLIIAFFYMSIFSLSFSTNFDASSSTIIMKSFQVLGSSFLLLIFSLLMSFLVLFVHTTIQLKIFKSIHNEEITVKEAIKIVFKQFFGKTLKAALLVIGILSIALIIYMILLTIDILIITILGSHSNNFTLFITILLILLTILISIAYLIFTIWFSYSCIFTYSIIVYEKKDVIDSLKSSIKLVKNNWWRTFGFSYLFRLLISTLMSTVGSPIMILSIGPLYIKLIHNTITRQFSSMNFSPSSIAIFIIGLTIYTAIVSVVNAMANPVFNSLFYIDLKVRKKEIIPE